MTHSDTNCLEILLLDFFWHLDLPDVTPSRATNSAVQYCAAVLRACTHLGVKPLPFSLDSCLAVVVVAPAVELVNGDGAGMHAAIADAEHVFAECTGDVRLAEFVIAPAPHSAAKFD
mmetsp:Transcript_60812/g.51490  ORF Transcript_60812/g.51490 Transcript_60812/m.51490 type:complete len:117 (-) Transcript_60812:208-558(-)